jgi:hypothetical protein
MSKRRKPPRPHVPRERLEAAIAVHEEILKRHPANTETHKYSLESLAKLRAELARRDRKPNPRREPKRIRVESIHGLRVGQQTDTPRGPAVVRSIFKFKPSGPWHARVTNIEDGGMEGFEVSQLVKRKRRGKRRRVSGCYVVGRGRRRRRKANPAKKKRPVACYAVGKGRIRRRKMNRSAGRSLYALYAHRAGRAPLKYVGNSKFAAKGRAKLFRGQAEANAAAWVLKDSFPAALRGYTLTTAPHP